jgi:hypothetical protein
VLRDFPTHQRLRVQVVCAQTANSST